MPETKSSTTEATATSTSTPTAIPRTRHRYTPEDDVKLMKGVLKYGISWSKIYHDADIGLEPIMKSRGLPTLALRDHFRARFPLIYNTIYDRLPDSEVLSEDMKRRYLAELAIVLKRAKWDLEAHPHTSLKSTKGAQRRAVREQLTSVVPETGAGKTKRRKYDVGADNQKTASTSGQRLAHPFPTASSSSSSTDSQTQTQTQPQPLPLGMGWPATGDMFEGFADGEPSYETPPEAEENNAEKGNGSG